MEPFKMILSDDTIAAISTPAGVGGIAVIRISGRDAIEIVGNAWKGKNLATCASHSVHLGEYISKNGDILDQAVATIYKAPHSFTGEDVVELSTHGSRWIQREVMNDLICRGVRTAEPGEFTKRAFLNGRMDLAQAEGIADLISSSSKASHSLALSQTRGAFSKEFDRLRDKLIEFASLLELELDFSEEEVEFANRDNLKDLAINILNKLNQLADSFSTGCVLKDGVPVVIAGIPNSGKSSLLNLLLEDDKAIVSDIPGTTRDVIEDTKEINGILYRFYDTAGLRDTEDKIEGLGIERARASIEKAYIIIWIIDPSQPLQIQLDEINSYTKRHPSSKIILLQNKQDIYDYPTIETDGIKTILFSAKTQQGLSSLHERLHDLSLSENNPESDIILTNSRHYEAILKGIDSLVRAIEGLDSSLPTDLIAQDIREALHHLSSITGSISTDHLLHSIFSRFCIGK